MTKYSLIPLDKTSVSPHEISETLRNQLPYFTEGKFHDSSNPDRLFFPIARTSELLEEGVFYVVSPLDDQNRAEIELTDEQEDLLEWLVSNHIEEARITTL
ncbi:MAG: hypothetical protein OXN17_21545 [Candidatus Poribacteria bacterium]|nr:hypothetical protein [Candidatus Poribacteria bacterium]